MSVFSRSLTRWSPSAFRGLFETSEIGASASLVETQPWRPALLSTKAVRTSKMQVQGLLQACLAGLSVTALLTSQTAQAERPSCIPRHDMRILIRMALPDAVEALADRCKGALPPDAFLTNEGPGLASRFRYQAPVDPARARAAIEAATGQDLSSFASADTVTNLARQFVGMQIEQRVPLKDCKTVDSMMQLAGALPADAMAEAILLALEEAGPGMTKGLAICRPKDEGADR